LLERKADDNTIAAYPNFDKNFTLETYPNNFTLETDVSKLCLGAILSQTQDDNRLHSVTYASRSVEASYAISDLESLAVVWTVTHFRYYLHGHNVTVVTDHTTVKAILGAPNLIGRHARWWEQGVWHWNPTSQDCSSLSKNILNIDCLSRQSRPDMPAPQQDDNGGVL